MNEPLNTQILIGRIQEGSTDAREELCERYLERVYRAVRIRLGARLRQKVQSCDIVQEAMLDVLKGADNFECRSEGRTARIDFPQRSRALGQGHTHEHQPLVRPPNVGRWGRAP